LNLDTILLGNDIQSWLVALGILSVSILALHALGRFVRRGFARFARTTQTELDDLVAGVLGRTKVWLISVVAVFAASLALVLPEPVLLVLRRAAAIAVAIQVGIWASAAITFWVERFVERTAGEDAAAVTTVSALSFVARLAVWIVVLLLILDNVGVEVTALLTGLGIGGIAVALAVQSILGDLFASLSIILDKPFVVGDFLSLDDYRGAVEHVGLKTTRLRSINGEQLVISNSDLLESRLRNFGRMSDRRASFSVGVTYETPADKLAALPGWIREIVESERDVRFDRSHLARFGPYSIDFETVYFMTVPDFGVYMDTQQSINLALIERLAAEGVEFAYPTQVIYAAPLDPQGTGIAVAG
jgi:small-conductance mechanosensitive channel